MVLGAVGEIGVALVRGRSDGGLTWFGGAVGEIGAA